jgi:hypothetical protein
MADDWDDTELGAEKGRTKLSNQLPTRTGLPAMPAEETTVETVRTPCPVTELMQLGPVTVDRLKTRLLKPPRPQLNRGGNPVVQIPKPVLFNLSNSHSRSQPPPDPMLCRISRKETS